MRRRVNRMKDDVLREHVRSDGLSHKGPQKRQTGSARTMVYHTTTSARMSGRMGSSPKMQKKDKREDDISNGGERSYGRSFEPSTKLV